MLWMFITFCILGLVTFLSPQARLSAMNRLVQDFIVSAQERPLSNDIVIVAIDDESIAALGRWPWRRTMHAELLDRISADRPAAIGLDVIFTEPELKYPHDDALLAAAIKRSAPVVLPVFLQTLGHQALVTTPLPAIAGNATLGQAHINVDDDGIVRSVPLQYSLENKMWDHFSAALLKAQGHDLDERTLSSSSSRSPSANKSASNTRQILVPFSGGAGHFQRVSYIDVIQGTVPAGTFAGKYVLVGATAVGIADQYATPTTSKSHLMPGVEIIANVADGLLHNHHIRPAADWQNVALNLAFVCLALAGFSLLNPLPALILTIASALALLATSYYSASLAGILFAPAAGISGLIFLYPLWSWHRLSTAADYLAAQLTALQQQDGILFSPGTQVLVSDFLDKRIAALESATSQLQSLHRFITDSIDNLPYPTLVCGRDAVVRIANIAAARHFEVKNPEMLVSRRLTELTSDLMLDEHRQALITDEGLLQGKQAIEGEAKDSRGRELIVKCVPISDSLDVHTGWILNLVDVSDMRQAERDREDAFRFITHDIRAPLSSIITLLELHRLQSTGTKDELLQRLERHADNALGLADGFVNLSRAKSGDYHFEDSNLYDLLSEAADEVWALSHARQMSVEMTQDHQPAYAMVDRQLIKRVLANLLSNAIKFSPAQSRIHCEIADNIQEWDVSIADQGTGIAEEKRGLLFQPFNRLHAQSHPEVEGTGLGLAFVHSVMQRHGGKVWVESQLGKGSTFHLLIPKEKTA